MPREMITELSAHFLAKNANGVRKTAVFASLFLVVACKNLPSSTPDPVAAVQGERIAEVEPLEVVIGEKVRLPEKIEVLVRNGHFLTNYLELGRRGVQIRKKYGNVGELLNQFAAARAETEGFITAWESRNLGVRNPSIDRLNRLKAAIVEQRVRLAEQFNRQIYEDGSILLLKYQELLLNQMALEKREFEAILDTKAALISEDIDQDEHTLEEQEETMEDLRDTKEDLDDRLRSLKSELQDLFIEREREKLDSNRLNPVARKRIDFAIERVNSKLGLLLSRSTRFEDGISELKPKMIGIGKDIKERGKQHRQTVLDKCRLAEFFSEFQAIVGMSVAHEIDIFEIIKVPQATILSHCGESGKARYLLSKHLARLGVDRSVLTDSNGSEWDLSLYHAMRREAQNLGGSDFDPTAYSVDAASGAVIVLGSAYEKIPYTGRVFINARKIQNSQPDRFQQIGLNRIAGDPRANLLGNSIGEAIISRGFLAESHVYNSTSNYALFSSHQAYDDRGKINESIRIEHDVLGRILRAQSFDRNGKQIATRDYRPEAMKRFVGAYSATLGEATVEFKMVLHENGSIQLFDRNGTTPEGDGAWIYASGDVHLIFPEKAIPLTIVNQKPTGELMAVAVMDVRKNEMQQIPADDQRVFAKYINPLPANALLASRVRVGGELIYDRLDPSEFPFPFEGTVVEFFDRERFLKKREEPVKTGKHNGTVRWWYRHKGANGLQQLRFEAEYVNGDPEGSTVWYRADGSTEYEGFWTGGLLERATSWDATGAQSGQVVDSSGTLTFFHPNGQKRLEETFTDGKLSGSKFWDEEGNEIEAVDPQYIPARPRIILN